MSPKELSIGNYVLYGEGEKKHVVKIKELREGYAVDVNGVFYPYSDLQPLMITPEILEANDFKTPSGGPFERKNWSKTFGEQSVTIFLHEFNDIYYCFDFWVERPWDDLTKQIKFSQTWREFGDIVFAKKEIMNSDGGDIQGLHVVQNAMAYAGIDYEWKMPEKN